MNNFQNLTIESTSKPKKPKTTKTPIENQAKTPSPSDFSFSITRIAVSQICRSIGFKAVELHALETLTNIATRYLQIIAKSAASFSNTANRTDSNIFDLINAFHDLYLLQGFPGGSKLHRGGTLLRSGALKELAQFVNYSQEIPFAKPIPRSNWSQKTFTSHSPLPSACDSCTLNPRGLHIPKWLPDFPEERLYKNWDEGLNKGRKCGEKLWEDMGSIESFGELLEGNEVGGRKVKKEGKMELAKKGGKVRFRIGGVEGKGVGIGLNLRNGVCRGGKRVFWNYNRKKNDVMVGEIEDQSSTLKRKR